MDESLDAFLQLDECAVVGQRNDLSVHLRAERIAHDDIGPRILRLLFVAEGHALRLRIEFEDHHFDLVADVNVQNRRISLSLKALEQNPWDSAPDRYPVGSVVSGKVRNLTDFGAFVELEEGIDGLIHISDMSWNRRLKHPNEVLKKGDTVQARVINVDPENQRLSLSIKEFLPNEWDNFAKAHNIGDEMTGTVSKITDFGLFIRLADGVEGLAHVSEVQRDPKVKLDKAFHVGEPIRVKIIKIDWTERKIGLSTRDVEPAATTPVEPETSTTP